MRSGVAEQPERSSRIPRPVPAVKARLLAIYRQVGWLLVASNLPSKLKTLWRLIAREMTEPHFHRSKRPRKHKSPRPF
jgi:hypothetical protein